MVGAPAIEAATAVPVAFLVFVPAPPAKTPDSGEPPPDARRRTSGAAGFRQPGRGGFMQLTRWNPFVELDEIQQRLNRLSFDRTPKTGDASFADFSPAVDIEETDTEF